MASVQALVLPVGIDLYAIKLEAAREVVARPLVTSLPTSSPTVLGLFNLRGEIVPVFDTSALLGMGPIASAAYAVVIDTAAGPAALAATDVPDASVLEGPVGTTETPGTLGAYSIGPAVAVLVEVESLLAPARTGAGE